MKAIFNFLLLALLGLTFSARLRNIKAVKCQGIGFDCDWESKCCKGYYCVNDRCQKEEAEDTLEYTPKGIRCNGSHLCPKNYKCESHRCILMTDVAIAKMIEKRKHLLE